MTAVPLKDVLEVTAAVLVAGAFVAAVIYMVRVLIFRREKRAAQEEKEDAAAGCF